MVRAHKALLVVFVFALPYHQCAAKEQDASIVASSIGRLVLLHDEITSYKHGGTNPFGIGPVYIEFEKIYEESIKPLPEENRVDFFMSSMWHLTFSESYLEQFEALVFSDCFRAFRARLARFIEAERELSRSTIRLQIAEMVLRDLDQIAAREKKAHR